MQRSSLGQEVKGQGYRSPNLDLEAWRRHHLDPLSRVDRGIQLATKMLPLQRGGCAAQFYLHPSTHMAGMRLADALVFKYSMYATNKAVY